MDTELNIDFLACSWYKICIPIVLEVGISKYAILQQRVLVLLYYTMNTIFVATEMYRNGVSEH